MSEEKGQKKRQKKNRRLRKKKNLPVIVRTRKRRSSRWKGSVRKSKERQGGNSSIKNKRNRQEDFLLGMKAAG